jgi:hypothetical protein
MSDATTHDDEVDVEPTDIKSLREAADRGREHAEKASVQERRAVFAEAGVPRQGHVANLFRDSYKGELSEEAVAKAWSDLQAEMGGLPKNQPVEDTTDEQVLEMEKARGNLGDPSLPQDPPPPDKKKAAWTAYQEARAKGEPPREASAEVLTRLIDAAVKGEDWALVEPVSDADLRSAKEKTK